MKKITNNARWTKISMILNVLILVTFVIMTVFMNKFDKENSQLVAKKHQYETGLDSLKTIEHPRKLALQEFEYYTNKVDTLQAQTPPTDKEELKVYTETLERNIKNREEKKANLAKVDSTINAATKAFAPIKTEYETLMANADVQKGKFRLWMIITIVLVVSKLAAFATWNYFNLKNLHAVSIWMKKGSQPFWAYVSWIIPVYFFIKPYSVSNEIWEETEYALVDKKIVEKDKISPNTEFNISLWWCLVLVAMVFIPIIFNSTFFSVSPMYFKFNHTTVTIVGIICWIIYMIMDAALMMKYNKLNKLMVENEDKF